MKMALNHQTRNDPRFSYDATILIDNYPHGVHYIARMVNFSKGGACLHTDVPFPQGLKLIMAIENSPYPDCPGIYVAVVKWCRRVSDLSSTAAYEIGIRYLSTRPEDLNQVRLNDAFPIQIGRNDRHWAQKTESARSAASPGAAHGNVVSFEERSRKKKTDNFRKHQRKSCVIPTHYTTSKGIYWGIVKNINRRGIYIEKYLKNQDSLNLGESITVMMPSKITNRTIKIIGEIVWMDRDGYGVRFKSLSR
jgi:hypothetical protein